MRRTASRKTSRPFITMLLCRPFSAASRLNGTRVPPASRLRMSAWLPSVPAAAARIFIESALELTTAAPAASPKSTQVLRSSQFISRVSSSTPTTRMRLELPRQRERATSSASKKPAQPLPARS